MKKRCFAQVVIVFMLGIILTTTLQVYIGKPILYAARQGYYHEKTLTLHSAILTNNLPKGVTWSSLGANTTNLRIVVIYLAEWLHQLSGKSLFSIYFWIDNAAMVLNFVLLFCFLAIFFSAEWALFGGVFFYFLQTTTYFNHYFHPWDRLSLTFWILSLGGIYLARRATDYLGLLLVFLIGLLVKFDLIIVTAIPFIYYWFQPRDRWKALMGPLSFIMGFGMLWYLVKMRPGGPTADSPSIEVYKPILIGNLKSIRDYGFTYSPNLVFSLPIVVGFLGWKHMELFVRVCFVIGILGLPAYFMTVWFNETRAEMPLLLLILPGTIEGFKTIFSEFSTKKK